jgi:hypothetical protein
MFNRKPLREYGFINGEEVSMKIFEHQFDLAIKNKPIHTQMFLAKQVVNGEIVKIGKKFFNYEEREMTKIEVKEQKRKKDTYYSNKW